MSKHNGIPCPAHCGRFHPPGQFLCVKCWQRLPANMQNAVWRTWRAVERINPQAFPHDYLLALRTYREVRSGALLYLTNLSQPEPAAAPVACGNAVER